MNIWFIKNIFRCSYFMASDKLWVSFALPVAGPCAENHKSHVQRRVWERLFLYSTKCSLFFWFWTQRKKSGVGYISCCILSVLMPSIKFLGGRSSAGANLPLLLSVLQQLVIFLLSVFPERCIFLWIPYKAPAWTRLCSSVLGREEHVRVPVHTEVEGLLP